MRFRRRTVIREREVTVTEEAHDDPGWQPTIAWHYEPPPARYQPPPAELQGVDELDPVRHVPITGPAPVFARLVRHPPVTAPWRAHLGFTADLVTRAVQQDAAPPGPWPVVTAPAVVVEVPRTYAELEPDTLAGEFVPLELGPPLPELDRGRST